MLRACIRLTARNYRGYESACQDSKRNSDSYEFVGSDECTSILIVKQKVREVLDICNRVYSLKLGKVSFQGKPEELKDKGKLKELFL